MSLVALVLSMTGVAPAAKRWITGKDIKPSSITGANIKDGSLTAADLRDSSFVGARGPKGDVGAQGAQGIQGAVGPLGDPGPQGDPGSQGDKGDKGDAGDAGRDGIGPAYTHATDPMVLPSGAVDLAHAVTVGEVASATHGLPFASYVAIASGTLSATTPAVVHCDLIDVGNPTLQAGFDATADDEIHRFSVVLAPVGLMSDSIVLNCYASTGDPTHVHFADVTVTAIQTAQIQNLG